MHIICLDIPYPVNYGGLYDLFYKLPALQQQGVHIHLHCFYTNALTEQKELNKYCTTVDYYERGNSLQFVSSGLPYIVESRRSEALLENLLQDNYPIFMEGVHCTWPVMDKRFNNRKLFVRMHNVEYKYYEHLYHCASNLKKKLYYWLESKLLKKYEHDLAGKATAYWPVSVADTDIFRHEMHYQHADYIPLFLPEWTIQCLKGTGLYCLYHGKLSVDENEYAALWLLKNVFNNIDIPFMIAGKDPGSKLLDEIEKHPNAYIIANPDEEQMQDIIFKAHINILPSFNSTGIKLKLLNALYNGRHCVVNNDMIKDTGLKDACHVVNTASEFKEIIQQLYHQPFTEEETQLRKKILHHQFSNTANAQQMVGYIWG